MTSTTRIADYDHASDDGSSPRRAEPARIALGIDFSSASLGAAGWATRHVAPNAEAIAVHVVPLPDASPYDHLDHAARERAVRLTIPAVRGGLGGFAATLGAGGTRAVVRVGRPSRELARAAERFDADLLVLGRSRQAAWDTGHETEMVCRVARQAARDVLVVPEGNAARPEHVVAAVDDGPDAARVAGAARALAVRLGARPTLLHVVPSGWLAQQRLTLVAPDARALGGTAMSPATASLRVHAMARRWLVELLTSQEEDG
ncbi:MAG TPA: universal stress protein, partial [Gemmatimonadaceae bacterium]|nr:universal stress protein [Gemmatimonadaceae bacterium]